MLQHIWTVPCRFSMVDRETNNVSLIQALEEVTIHAEQPHHPREEMIPAVFDVVTLWARQDEGQAAAGFGRLLLQGPGGEELGQYRYDIDLRDTRRLRVVSRMVGFPARDTGRYTFRIERRMNENEEWGVAATVPVWVEVIHPQAQPEPERNGGAE